MAVRTDNRRRFFRLLARETLAAADELRGRPQLALTQLPTLPDEALAGLVPKFLEGVRVVRDANELRAHRPKGDVPVHLGGANEAACLCLDSFDGKNSLSTVSRQLACALGWERARAYAFVRAFFLRLVGLRLCVPANALDEPHASSARGGGQG